MRAGRYGIVALALVVGACAPKRVDEDPIMRNNDRVSSADDRVHEAAERAQERREEQQSDRAQVMAAALEDCEPGTCAALARGEVSLGMSRAEVLAATGTTESAWTIRRAGDATVLVPTGPDGGPADAAGELAIVQLRDDRVASYAYREGAGVRLVDDRADATLAGRADGLAELLVREGDDYAARGDLRRALDRYDRADVLRPGDPELNYRIAGILDKQLRPIEALIRYRLFLHQLELERIGAVGDAYAKLANAIAHARERIIVLEKHGDPGR